MRATLAFLGVIFGTLLLAALLAWPLWLVVHGMFPGLPFHRIVSRFWQLLLLVALLFAVRRMGLRGRADWGYGLPRPLFLRQVGAGLAVGVATMLPMTGAMAAMGLLELRPGVDLLMIGLAIAGGLVAGLAVGLLEETFFRGLMYQAVSRESGFAPAAISTALVYAAIHFLARSSIPAAEVQWHSGFRLLGEAFANFAQPSAILDSFITLALVGLLLAGARRRTGAIAACIGLHMGWVTVIKASTDLGRRVDSSQWSFLIGSFDGYTGWLVACWGVILVAFAWARGWLAPAAR
jgi:membrane protease YdiL (CAAX protease family)